MSGGEAAHREQRADRNVNLARQNDHRHADRDQQRRRVVQCQIAQVRRAEKRRRDDADRDEQDAESQGCREFAFVPIEGHSSEGT
jgi:hypothetical protein